MEVQIVKDKITRNELAKIAKNQFGDMVKAVVDLKQEIMAVGGELHADEEAVLNEKCGSKREDVWGVNLYPEKPENEWVEFSSMINIKPHLGNRSRGVEDPEIQIKIKNVIKKLVAY